MQMFVPPKNQGQIVEVAYGWLGAKLYKRVHHRSDRTTDWYVADQKEADALEDDWDENYAPPIKNWSECADPEPEDP